MIVFLWGKNEGGKKGIASLRAALTLFALSAEHNGIRSLRSKTNLIESLSLHYFTTYFLPPLMTIPL